MANILSEINGLISTHNKNTKTDDKMATTSSVAVATTVAGANPATPVSAAASSTTSSIISSSSSSSSSSAVLTSSSSSSISSILSSSSISSSSSSSIHSSSSSSSISTISIPLTTSTPLTTSASTTPTTTSSSTIKTITSTIPAPSLVTTTVKSSSSAAIAGSTAGSSGIGGSSLSIGALAGIIIGGIVVLLVIALLVTRTIRKRSRARRTRHRSSMFEPWQTAPVIDDDDPAWEKPHDAPAQSYPLQNSVVPYLSEPTYPPTAYYDQQPYNVNTGYDNYAHPDPSATSNLAGAGAGANYYAEPAAPAHGATEDYGYPPQGQYPAYQENVIPPQDMNNQIVAGVGAGAIGAAAGGVGIAAAASHGLRDGTMVLVKVGFVRSMDDELAINPGQQLFLHQAYDDGWSLCEDEHHNRGVVPLSCLEPIEPVGLGPPGGISRSTSDNSLAGATPNRRSSLFVNAQAAGAYLAMPSQ